MLAIPSSFTPVGGALGKAFLLLVNALYVHFMALSDREHVYPNNYAQTLIQDEDPVFDFVVVGGSAAGCVIANELAINNFKVLLLEAGGTPSPTSQVPFFGDWLLDPNDVWRYEIEPNSKSCLGFKNKICVLNRGHVLGGYSVISNLHYSRGSTREFKTWNYPEWGPDVMLRLFRNVEHFVDDEVPHIESPGLDGNLHLHYLHSQHYIKTSLRHAYYTIGYRPVKPESLVGYMDKLVMVRQNQRQNMAKAYFRKSLGNPNLFLSLHSLATKILLTNPQDRRVKALEATINGAKKIIRVKKEIILTAGTVNNPQLLMQSGVGPAKQLAANKIPLVVDAPGVGQNMKSHFGVNLIFQVDKDCNATHCFDDPFNINTHFANTFEYIMFKKGAFASCYINDFVLEFSTKGRRGQFANVNVYHRFFEKDDPFFEEYLSLLNYEPGIIKELHAANKQSSILLFMPTLNKPKSVGEVVLENHKPKIRANSLSNETDLETLVDASKVILSATEHMKDVYPRLVKLSCCKRHTYKSDAHLRCLVRHFGHLGHNWGGTTKMGDKCDPLSVVNKDLEVHNVRCLRIGDSSISPGIVLTNNVVLDAAIGTKLSDLLLQKWVKGYVSPFRKVEVAENIVEAEVEPEDKMDTDINEA